MQNHGRQHGGTRLPIWRDANRLLVEIETAVRAFPRSHGDTVGSDLRVLAMRVFRLLSRALAATGTQRWRSAEGQMRLCQAHRPRPDEALPVFTPGFLPGERNGWCQPRVLDPKGRWSDQYPFPCLIVGTISMATAVIIRKEGFLKGGLKCRVLAALVCNEHPLMFPVPGTDQQIRATPRRTNP